MRLDAAERALLAAADDHGPPAAPHTVNVACGFDGVPHSLPRALGDVDVEIDFQRLVAAWAPTVRPALAALLRRRGDRSPPPPPSLATAADRERATRLVVLCLYRGPARVRLEMAGAGRSEALQLALALRDILGPRRVLSVPSMWRSGADSLPGGTALRYESTVAFVDA
jgi:hypothetical protein